METHRGGHMPGLGPLMKIHPREKIVDLVQEKLQETWMLYYSKLTTAEAIRVISEFVSRNLGGIAKYAIRAERHPDDPGQPGGLA